MSKKSYKQIKNRLYREIKRRIIAENNIHYEFVRTKYDTIKIEKLLHYDDPIIQSQRQSYQKSGDEIFIPDYEKLIRKEMARAIASELDSKGYIKYYTSQAFADEAIHDYIRLGAILKVAVTEEEYV